MLEKIWEEVEEAARQEDAPGWTEEYGGQKIIAWQPLPELYGEEKDVGQ